MIMLLPLPPPPPPPPPPDTITVIQSTDYRGMSFPNRDQIFFATTDFARATFDSSQFGPALISDNVTITGDSFRNFIDVYLPTGGGSFSAAGWNFVNWVPFTPLQNDQVNIFGSEFADTITGSSQADSIVGGGGDDVLNGGGGADILVGGAGVDTLQGGTGDDSYRLADVHLVNSFPLLRFAYDSVVEDANGGVDTVQLYRVGIVGSYMLPDNVENGSVFGNYQGGVLVSGNMGTYSLFGNALANRLAGNEDANYLGGQDGADVLIGNGGNDTLEGGRGGDTLNGGDGIDTASYASAGAAVTVSLAIAGPQATGGAGVDQLSFIENLLGSAFNDTLTGNDLANGLDGGAGRDTLTGGLGNDTLNGGTAHDTLLGGGGADTLIGGSGPDTLTGNAGRDTFVFAPGSGADTITDFSDLGKVSDDVIDVSGFGFTRLADIVRTASGNDLILDFGNGDSVVLSGYLSSHAISSIKDDFIFALI